VKKTASIVLLLAFVLCALVSCKTINRDALAAWTAGDVVIMQDLQDYRAAQGKPADDVKVHLAKAFGEITADEENALVAETLADIQADPKRSAQRKASYATRVSAHLNLFNSLKQ
jgi:antirestriction protein ArdC